ncbi:MAG: SUMF1/EgtB/PvdO family nonheme iron enzyme [Anaerolineales bacterium]|jgi:hypothetical protein|nr:SUMF1/EgtB/PvdO family nonheme iron enzyme [Anaerolineales bacterium]
MSNWIRIDDDTYIDDSLITCAEYRLFLDEMRVQEKYYQPDHWSDYHFPKGHARHPILGMRHSDAKAFCEWLTLHNNDGWQYRLPSQDETQKFPVDKPYSLPIGHWVSNKNSISFAWIGANPQNLDEIKIKSERNRDFDQHYEIELARAQSRDLVHTLESANARELTHAITLAGKLTNELDNSSGFGNVRQLTLALTHELYRIMSKIIIRAQAKDHIVSDAIATNQYLSQTKSLASNRRKYVDVNNAFKLSIKRALSQPYAIMINGAITVSQEIEHAIDVERVFERRAGRFPTFEGIRLVRERIK